MQSKEKELGIEPDQQIEQFFKAAATAGKRHSIVTDLMLKLLGLDVSIAVHCQSCIDLCHCVDIGFIPKLQGPEGCNCAQCMGTPCPALMQPPSRSDGKLGASLCAAPEGWASVAAMHDVSCCFKLFG